MENEKSDKLRTPTKSDEAMIGSSARRECRERRRWIRRALSLSFYQNSSRTPDETQGSIDHLGKTEMTKISSRLHLKTFMDKVERKRVEGKRVLEGLSRKFISPSIQFREGSLTGSLKLKQPEVI